MIEKRGDKNSRLPLWLSQLHNSRCNRMWRYLELKFFISGVTQLIFNYNPEVDYYLWDYFFFFFYHKFMEY